jgi:hypothetical protein
MAKSTLTVVFLALALIVLALTVVTLPLAIALLALTLVVLTLLVRTLFFTFRHFNPFRLLGANHSDGVTGEIALCSRKCLILLTD